MTTDLSPSATSLDLARRLIARDAALTDGHEARGVALALQRTCSRVCEVLRDSLGDDGCDALLARALSSTEAHHPALELVRRKDGDGIHLDGVVKAMEAKTAAEVTAAIEALLGALMDVLSRLIGEDMAIRIMDHDTDSRNGGRARGS